MPGHMTQTIPGHTYTLHQLPQEGIFYYPSVKFTEEKGLTLSNFAPL
jgi:hypothetical protein